VQRDNEAASAHQDCRATANGAHIPILNHTVAALRFFFSVTLKRSDIIEHTTFIHSCAPRAARVATSGQLFARFPHLVIITKTLLLDPSMVTISLGPGADQAVREK
jgi:hypothetical protein